MTHTWILTSIYNSFFVKLELFRNHSRRYGLLLEGLPHTMTVVLLQVLKGLYSENMIVISAFWCVSCMSWCIGILKVSCYSLAHEKSKGTFQISSLTAKAELVATAIQNLLNRELNGEAKWVNGKKSLKSLNGCKSIASPTLSLRTYWTCIASPIDIPLLGWDCLWILKKFSIVIATIVLQSLEWIWSWWLWILRA